MDDSDTEARRLLTAATTDMPPGIDLLEGFAAARQRDRARRTRRTGVLSAGITVAAALVTALTLTTSDSAPPALAAVTGALTRTLAQSYHFTEQEGSYGISHGRVTFSSHWTCTDMTDLARNLGTYSCPKLADTTRFRTVGRYVYAYRRVPVHGKHWERMPACPPPSLSTLSGAVNGFVSATPPQMLAAIKRAAKVTVAGPVSGPGWTGTRYAFIRTDPLAKQHKLVIRGTVDVDKQGRARVLDAAFVQTGPNGVSGLTQSLTFSDFGAPVTVIPPPADQTFSSHAHAC